MRIPYGIFTQQQASGGGTEYSIWGSSTVGTQDSDFLDVVLGTKFRASSNGYIVGIRWQKASTSAGVGDVALWQGTTNVSGTRTVSGETSSGWQRMNFASPVAITASTIYIAAARYKNPSNYFATSSLFASSGVINGPLEAVANSVSANGVYTYSSTMVVPTSTFSSSCYYIDVIYTQ